ncbi:hypothetical protein GC209_13170 [bacterium]|nr:hypothetical protein [bacterium]
MRWSAITAVLVVSGCSAIPAMFSNRSENAALVQGPPVQDVVTAYDSALSCLRGKVPHNVFFGVGTVVDATGKESFNDGNAGKFVTQGAGEMVQSALFKAGVSVVNRRDDAITIAETNWGIRDIKRQVPVNFYLSGSINSLDFIPGGGFAVQVAGVGPRYRQSRILVALDMTMTDAYTGRIVASIPLQKQIFTSEVGGSNNSFFGATLVQLDAGGMKREAINFALRQMLSLATFEVLGQVLDQGSYAPCKALIDAADGGVTTSGTSDPVALREAIRAMKEAANDNSIKPLTVPIEQASAPASGQAGAAPGGRGNGVSPQPAAETTPGSFKGQKSTQAATMAIRAAKDSMSAPDTKTAVEKAAEALKLSNLALLLLKEAASEGFTGDAGEVAAVVVQQALQAAKEAGVAAAKRANDNKPASGTTAPTAQPNATGSDALGAQGPRVGVTNVAPNSGTATDSNASPPAPIPGGLPNPQQPDLVK